MEKGAEKILAKHGCLYMKNDYKQLFKELENYYREGTEFKNCNLQNVSVPKGTVCPECGEDESIDDWQTYFRCRMCDTKF